MEIIVKNKTLYTKNLVPGKSVYGEKLISIDGVEYREWVASRSKLAAAILNGLKDIYIKSSTKVLYLGAASGTTVSHVSDIVGTNGLVYAIEFSERVIRKLLRLCEERKNIVPIFADARKPDDYYWVEIVDVVYVDLSDPQEVEIGIRNAKEFLKDDGWLLIAVKSQSIDVAKEPKKVYEEAKVTLKNNGFSVKSMIDLEPYEKKHTFIVASLQSRRS